MKHVYRGTDIRNHPTPSGAPPSLPPQVRPDPEAAKVRALLFVAVAVLVLLLVGFAVCALWSWSGRNPRPFVPGPDGASSSAEAYLWTNKGQLNQLFEFMRNSSFVQGNDHYREILSQVKFRYDDRNDAVNAYSRARRKWLGEDAQEVLCFAGAARFARLISLGWAAELEGREGAVQRLLDGMKPGQFSVLTDADAAALLRGAGLEDALENPAVRARAESISSGMLSFILAHELGHQALGHVFGDADSHGVSRNQEREADSFASNVLETSAFGEYMFVGELCWQYALATQQKDSSAPGTHPEAQERMENLLREHPELAKACGLGPENL